MFKKTNSRDLTKIIFHHCFFRWFRNFEGKEWVWEFIYFNREKGWNFVASMVLMTVVDSSNRSALLPIDRKRRVLYGGITSHFESETRNSQHFFFNTEQDHLEYKVHWVMTSLHPTSLTVRPWKIVVGRFLSYLEGNFSGAFAVKLREGTVFVLGKERSLGKLMLHEAPRCFPDSLKTR